MAEAGTDYSQDSNQASQKHTREYMRKLRDAETVHKLQQIAEVDENEDSDDAFGPVADNDEDAGYQMVSNRSTYRQGTASRDGPRAPVEQEEDDGFNQPIPAIDVEDAGSSSGAASKKKKKKKGKKKKAKSNLAEIGEDMLDSPVNSAGNDDDASPSRALNEEPTESHASANNNSAKDADVVDEQEDNND